MFKKFIIKLLIEIIAWIVAITVQIGWAVRDALQVLSNFKANKSSNASVSIRTLAGLLIVATATALFVVKYLTIAFPDNYKLHCLIIFVILLLASHIFGFWASAFLTMPFILFMLVIGKYTAVASSVVVIFLKICQIIYDNKDDNNKKS